ncbi:GNAT family N-acetyltransferase [Methyloceanibacter sp.]|uniref:GNAT family N-acetyltransferase n=1 Tax=Methyloceanibacter sp. TaxID=1965321 RepID=UPI002D58E85B|nr:GNAT family N-acetyltransferase [Methyloceanibacter sp.]HZP10598.1 GNAT family N-acetyltransferase [Methyloceanibacter sp.]
MSADEQDLIRIVEAPYGSDLYRQSVLLREEVLRIPLGLTLSEEELKDDVQRRHFCALSHGAVVGSVSLRPLDAKTVQLRQMAVAEDRRREKIGAELLKRAEAFVRKEGFRRMVLNARLGAEGFYARFGYVASGDPFDEKTIPHIRMSKDLA